MRYQGQEKESSTAGLAKMNAVLHNKATIKIMAGNTFSDPQFIKNEDSSELERFDYIVANPPFWYDISIVQTADYSGDRLCLF